MKKEEQLQQLVKQRDDHVTKIFWAGLQIAALFAIPLAIAILVGLYVDGMSVWILLPISFVFSWILTIRYFRQISKKMKAIDADIIKLRQELEPEQLAENNPNDEE